MGHPGGNTPPGALVPGGVYAGSPVQQQVQRPTVKEPAYEPLGG